MRVLHVVSKDPVRFSSKTSPCVVCGGVGRPFEGCDRLNDVEYLRSHHIQYYINIRRMQKNLTKMPGKNASINYVATVFDDDDDDDDQAEVQDFRTDED